MVNITLGKQKDAAGWATSSKIRELNPPNPPESLLVGNRTGRKGRRSGDRGTRNGLGKRFVREASVDRHPRRVHELGGNKHRQIALEVKFDTGTEESSDRGQVHQEGDLVLHIWMSSRINPPSATV